jgi:tetratricopeptide (TPR) repeat protein
VAEARSAPVPVPSTASPVTVGTSRNAYRDAARRAYNLRDIPWAIHYYRQHLAKVPRDTDALGELGNVYYQTGNLPVAAGLFYDAARVLLDRGKRDAASRLLLAVSEGNPALANDLYARLSASAKR